MSRRAAIVADRLSKRYVLGDRQERYRTLREGVMRTAAAPFRAIGAALRREKREPRPSLWALEDVSFEIKRGEVVGIVGRNGAGKSTLLKILSRITEPTRGYVDITGRVGSLLEVGTGFHNELTGRENIFLNGAILGMKRRDIERQFDEIVAFAEVEQFVDTPVKRYSSGMYMRLAFAVAAHLEPDILLVDEVLAVGDAAFQRKCLGKLGDVASDGRTVLFVSHNMGAIREMCQSGIVLDRGTVHTHGHVSEVIEAYYRLIGALQDGDGGGADRPHRAGFGPVRLDCDGADTVAQGRGFSAETTLRLGEDTAGFVLHCVLEDMNGRSVFSLQETHTDLGVTAARMGAYDVRVQFPALWLNPGLYALYFKVLISGHFGSTRYVSDKIPLDVDGKSSRSIGVVLHPEVAWDVAAAEEPATPVGT
jgi:lipopolysaccharide transport system ATP-binding protein